MLPNIAWFELRYQLRRPITLIAFLVFALLGFVFGSATGTVVAASYANAPIKIATAIGTITVVAMFLSIATLADVALRDAETRMDSITRTAPVSAATYLSARFLGAFVIVCFTFLGAVLGYAAALYMPWVPDGAIGPFRLAAYVLPYFVIAVPNLFVTGAIFYAVASATRSVLATYLSAVVLFLVSVMLPPLMLSSAFRSLGALSETFGLLAMWTDAAYWSNVEQNTLLIPLDGMLLWNRVLWVGIGLVLLVVSFALYAFEPQRKPRRRLDLVQIVESPIMRERPVLLYGGAGGFDQLKMRIGHEVGTILRSWTFYVLLLLGVAVCVGSLLAEDGTAQNPVLPYTYVIIDTVASSFGFVALLVPVAYGGELIWRDRKSRIASVIDATPTSNWVFVTSKIIAIAFAVLTLLVVLTIVGIGYQLTRGVTDIEIGFYLVKLGLVVGLPAIMLGVLAMLVQTVTNQRFVGLLIMLMLLIAIPAAPLLGIENPLLILFRVPDFVLSDMNRYGHYLARTMWFCAYWSCVTVLVALVTHLIWVRGTGSLWTRIRQAHLAITPAVATVAGVALAGAAGAAGYIYWNTNVRNTFPSSADVEQLQVEYEKKFRSVEALPQPRIVDIDMQVDLNPSERGHRSHGRYVLANRTDRPIERVVVEFSARQVEQAELQDAELAEQDKDFQVYQFRPRTPFLPGETRTLTFASTDATPGFRAGDDNTPIAYNGSFAHAGALAPSIGIEPLYYLRSAARRKEFGLEPLPELAHRDDPVQLKRNLFSRDADFVPFAITVSTSADQIALAPGDLEREWTEGDRRFFRYRLSKPAVNFWSVVSARYTVTRDTWNGVELAVYHIPKHATNAPRMIEGMKQALEYYTANFGPFPHKQLRIAEFPRYQSFAQSFPSLIPFSEAMGFIMDLRDSAFDYVFYVTAHETAHQWWGHQVIGANVEGSQFLSESLAEYSALMVVEHRYGTHRMRPFLKQSLDVYLRGRQGTSSERPLAVTPKIDQEYVRYQKGSLALYALKDAIGEDAVNRVLAKLLREHGFKSDPYPTTLDFLKLLRAEAGSAHEQLIVDLIEKITLWDLSVIGSEASERSDGKWHIRMNVRAKKLYSAGNGEETEAPLDQPIDIGLFAADPDARAFSDKDVIALEKRPLKSGDQTIEFVVDRKPAFVGVDPYLKLISRNTSNNVKSLGAKAGS
jgi:ABC-2 type transport system permease protein